MKHTLLHTDTPSYSLKEKRLAYELNVSKGRGGAESHDEEAELELQAEIAAYKAEQMKQNVPENADRTRFLENLGSTDTGRIALEKNVQIMFGIDENEELVIVKSKSKSTIEALMKSDKNPEAEGVHTLSLIVGGKRREFIVDPDTYDALNAYSAIKLNDLPTIAEQKIPNTPSERRGFVNKYKTAALKNPSMLALDPVKVPLDQFTSEEYNNMVMAVLEKHPTALQYVLEDWATTSKEDYSRACELAVSKIATGDEKNMAIVLRSMKLDNVSSATKIKMVGTVSEKKCEAAIYKTRGTELFTILKDLEKAALRVEDRNTPPTDREKKKLADACLTDGGDFTTLIENYIQDKPALALFLPIDWSQKRPEEFKRIWINAVKASPAILKTANLQYFKERFPTQKEGEAIDLYGTLMADAAQKKKVGPEKTVDNSALLKSIDPKWIEERPKSYRALFIKDYGLPTAGPVGDDTLFILLSPGVVDETIFNKIDNPNVVDPRGFAKVLTAALTPNTLVKIMGKEDLVKMDRLKRELKIINATEKLRDMQKQVMEQHPELYADTMQLPDNRTLARIFQNADTIRLYLEKNPEALAKIDTAFLEEHKNTIINLIAGQDGNYEDVAKLVVQLPSAWKDNAEDMKRLVSRNAFVYQYLSPTLRENKSILIAALNAHSLDAGTLDWNEKVIPAKILKVFPTLPTVTDVQDGIIGTYEAPRKQIDTDVDALGSSILKIKTSKEMITFMSRLGEEGAVLEAMITHKHPLVDMMANPVDASNFLVEALSSNERFFNYFMDEANLAVVGSLLGQFEFGGASLEKLFEKNRSLFAKLPAKKQMSVPYVNAYLQVVGVSLFREENFKTPVTMYRAMEAALEANQNNESLMRNLVARCHINNNQIFDGMSKKWKDLCMEFDVDHPEVDEKLIDEGSYLRTEFMVYSDVFDGTIDASNTKLKQKFKALKEFMDPNNKATRTFNNLLKRETQYQPHLRSMVADMKNVYNVSKLIGDRRVNWTQEGLAEKLKGIDPQVQAQLIVEEMITRMEVCPPYSLTVKADQEAFDHHQSNLNVLYNALISEPVKSIVTKKVPANADTQYAFTMLKKTYLNHNQKLGVKTQIGLNMKNLIDKIGL